MSDLTKDDRRRYTNLGLGDLMHYRLPLAGIVSILHRITGALLFLALPGVLWLLNQSLNSEISFARFKSLMSGVGVKLVVLVILAAYLFHLCAGIRHLFMDMHVGLEKETGKHSAAAAIAVSAVITIVVALKLFGVLS